MVASPESAGQRTVEKEPQNSWRIAVDCQELEDSRERNWNRGSTHRRTEVHLEEVTEVTQICDTALSELQQVISSSSTINPPTYSSVTRRDFV